jgi:hypothetical protein
MAGIETIFSWAAHTAMTSCAKSRIFMRTHREPVEARLAISKINPEAINGLAEVVRIVFSKRTATMPVILPARITAGEAAPAAQAG